MVIQKQLDVSEDRRIKGGLRELMTKKYCSDSLMRHCNMKLTSYRMNGLHSDVPNEIYFW